MKTGAIERKRNPPPTVEVMKEMTPEKAAVVVVVVVAVAVVAKLEENQTKMISGEISRKNIANGLLGAGWQQMLQLSTA